MKCQIACGLVAMIAMFMQFAPVVDLAVVSNKVSEHMFGRDKCRGEDLTALAEAKPMNNEATGVQVKSAQLDSAMILPALPLCCPRRSGALQMMLLSSSFADFDSWILLP